GPAMPRRDRDEQKDRYGRLMMLLFKPWRRASDLAPVAKTWSEQFEEELVNLDREHVKIMENLQIMHECKDSRDD
ncbi:hypothetical protein FKP32DRAFT_1528435, partial [Trametes sanguinea]